MTEVVSVAHQYDNPTSGRLLKAAGHPLVAYLTLWATAIVVVTS